MAGSRLLRNWCQGLLHVTDGCAQAIALRTRCTREPHMGGAVTTPAVPTLRHHSRLPHLTVPTRRAHTNRLRLPVLVSTGYFSNRALRRLEVWLRPESQLPRLSIVVRQAETNCLRLPILERTGYLTNRTLQCLGGWQITATQLAKRGTGNTGTGNTWQRVNEPIRT